MSDDLDTLLGCVEAVVIHKAPLGCLNTQIRHRVQGPHDGTVTSDVLDAVTALRDSIQASNQATNRAVLALNRLNEKLKAQDGNRAWWEEKV